MSSDKESNHFLIVIFIYFFTGFLLLCGVRSLFGDDVYKICFKIIKGAFWATVTWFSFRGIFASEQDEEVKEIFSKQTSFIDKLLSLPQYLIALISADYNNKSSYMEKSRRILYWLLLIGLFIYWQFPHHDSD